MNQKELKHPQAGYSLVELAIVLVIIGLIVGAVMKGRELVESARLKSLMSQIQNYRLANATFMDRYGAMPGDFDEASQLIRADLRNGNNDNIISGHGLESGSEALNYWAHLAAADLISDPGQAMGEQPSFGHGAPKTKLGGGITVSYNPDGLTGHWFVVGSRFGNRGDGALLTPKQAYFLDRNFDNGDPRSGDFQCRQGRGEGVGQCLESHGKYNIDEDRPACVGYFKF